MEYNALNGGLSTSISSISAQGYFETGKLAQTFVDPSVEDEAAFHGILD